jgi:hypothetical protein
MKNAFCAFLISVMLGLSACTASAVSTSQAPAPPEGAASGASAADALSTASAAYSQSGGAETRSGLSLSAAGADQSAVYVTSGGSLTLTDADITTSGDTSSADYSSFYGLNAAVLAADGSTIVLSDSSISTAGTGANGAFATGSGSSVVLSNVTITATADGGHAVMATNGGAMTLTDVVMSTAGPHSGAIATDRGSGTIVVSGGSAATSGQDSPGIYSTGIITVSGAVITATGAEAAVIEGANAIDLTDVDLSTTIADKWGVMIYQSMSGDAEGTRGTFTMTGGRLSYSGASGPLFYVNNSTGIITLKGVDVAAASGVLLDASANSRWGRSGANGGTAILAADGQALSGDVTADNISSASLILRNGSQWTGAIDAAGTAAEATLSLDASSTWTVTADSHLTCLADVDGVSGDTLTNINGNGHTVTYDAGACAALEGRTYALAGGGALKPAD